MVDGGGALSHCQYCTQIHRVDAHYPRRQALFDLESDCPRCARHLERIPYSVAFRLQRA
jgi:hypothetical protein